jgi:hypothetical protein
MPKKRSKTAEEWLRGQVRELKKENRHLEKELKALKKKESAFDGPPLPSRYKKEEEEYHLPCTSESCGKGQYKEIMDLNGRLYGKCDVCGVSKRLDKK